MEQTFKLLHNASPSVLKEWIEAHHVIVEEITLAAENRRRRDNKAAQIQDEKGTGGLWELGEELTNEFILLHKNTNWDEDSWHEAIGSFIQEKLYL